MDFSVLTENCSEWSESQKKTPAPRVNSNERSEATACLYYLLHVPQEFFARCMGILIGDLEKVGKEYQPLTLSINNFINYLTFEWMSCKNVSIYTALCRTSNISESLHSYINRLEIFRKKSTTHTFSPY
uniref:Dimer_Tnp_hAT domain-containing protein n=1 Tax=Strongyloides venezuelensis TaxID=75913 RepID=A0A0K0G4Z4_STRVS